MIITEKEYQNIKEIGVSGRYVTNIQTDTFLDELNFGKVEELGKSEENRTIKGVTVGEGKIKLLMWSQMHGNESTTTKAVLDFLNFLKSGEEKAKQFLKSCTIKIIPILNPDGAVAYTRVNANNIDLNRDAQDLSQSESNILRKTYTSFLPDFCFNLHDQRTIFSVGETNKPATVSFLAPAFNEERSISESRKKSMQLIAAMNHEIQKHIPNQVGRYDDGFNANCTGDAFQMLNTPTMLFESGHFPEDYDREKTREYIFYALLKAVETISNNAVADYTIQDYYKIPENGKMFVDVLIENAEEIDALLPKNSIISILYRETLENNTIKFVPEIVYKGVKNKIVFGHKSYNCSLSNDLNELKKEKYWSILA